MSIVSSEGDSTSFWTSLKSYTLELDAGAECHLMVVEANVFSASCCGRGRVAGSEYVRDEATRRHWVHTLRRSAAVAADRAKAIMM